MSKLDLFKAKARALARSGYFYGLPPLEFELSFQEGSQEGPGVAKTGLHEGRTRTPLPRVESEA